MMQHNMDLSLKTGNYILEVLEDDQELMKLLGGEKIFPIVAPEDTNYPLVTYTRDNISIDYTKDIFGWDNSVTISYRIYSPDYDECVNIATRIRNLIERKEIEFDNEIKINDIRLISVYENYADDAFCETLTFQTWVE